MQQHEVSPLWARPVRCGLALGAVAAALFFSAGCSAEAITPRDEAARLLKVDNEEAKMPDDIRVMEAQK